MSSPQKLNSGLRYFFANLKPLGRFTIWGPPSIVALIALCIWQYQSHPELLGSGTPLEQPDGLINGVGENINNPFGNGNAQISEDSFSVENIQPPIVAPFNPGISPSAPSSSQSRRRGNASPSLANQPSLGQRGTSTPESSLLFAPLVPGNNSSLFAPKTGQSPLANAPDPNVFAPRPAEINAYPLQQAIGRQFTNQPNAATGLAPTNSQPQFAPLNNPPGLRSPTNSPYYSAQPAPVQPYNNSPYGRSVPQTQSYQQPSYNNSYQQPSYNNSYGRPASQVQPPIQSSQPYSPYTGGQPNYTQPQVNQPPGNSYNPYGVAVPQVQPAIENRGADF